MLTALATTRRLFATETWAVPTYRQVKQMGRALHDTCAKALGLTLRHRQHRHIDDRQLRAALAPSAPPITVLLRTRRLRYVPRLLPKRQTSYVSSCSTTPP